MHSRGAHHLHGVSQPSQPLRLERRAVMLAAAMTGVVAAAGSPARAASGQISVLTYGADPSGVRDSTAAFRAALAAGAVVYAPAGTYRVDVVIVPSGRVLRGDGAGRTILRASAGGSGVIRVVGRSTARARSITISRLSVRNPAQTAVRVDYADNVVISEVETSYARVNGISIYRSTQVSVDRCNVHNNGSFGVFVYQSRAVACRRNKIHRHTKPGSMHLGLQFKSSQNCLAEYNHIHDIAGYGIYTWCDYGVIGVGTRDYRGVRLADRGHVIRHNRVERLTHGAAAGLGIYLKGSGQAGATGDGTGHTVVGNVVLNSAGNGIGLDTITDSVVRGNQVRGSGAAAISLNARAARVRVEQNISSAAVFGIYVAGHRNSISRNRVTGLRPVSGRAGLRLAAPASGNVARGNRIISGGVRVDRRARRNKVRGTRRR